MKYGKYCILAVAVAMLLPVSALAREKNQGTLTLFDKAQIGNTVLKPGTYLVQWTGAGPEVQVNVSQNKQTVATTTAMLKDESNVHQDAVVLNRAPNHTAAEGVAEIDFAKLKEALVLTPATSNQNR